MENVYGVYYEGGKDPECARVKKFRPVNQKRGEGEGGETEELGVFTGAMVDAENEVGVGVGIAKASKVSASASASAYASASASASASSDPVSIGSTKA